MDNQIGKRKSIPKTTRQKVYDKYNGHVEFDFGSAMMDETIIGSLVFQTIFTRFEELKSHSDDFELTFTMEQKINDNG